MTGHIMMRVYCVTCREMHEAGEECPALPALDRSSAAVLLDRIRELEGIVERKTALINALVEHFLERKAER